MSIPDSRKKHPVQYKDFIIDPGSGLYIEEYFRSEVVRERKRAERKNDHFILLLIDFSRLSEKPGHENIGNKISDAVDGFTRETDIGGWYKTGSVIGVIFTDTKGDSKNIILEKAHGALKRNIPYGKTDQINISFYLFPVDGIDKDSISTESDLALYPDLMDEYSARSISSASRRGMDVAFSLLALVVFSPLFIVIPILIKYKSKGPVIFRQKRLGFGGREFTFFKFRSMNINNNDDVHREYVSNFIQNKSVSENSENEEETIFKIKNDSRVTSIGKLLRKSSLDELPQFINVLKGDMSLVGPRPPIPYETRDYSIWHRRRVAEVKPGITGLWQVYGRSTTTFDEMVRMDIQYIQNPSCRLYLKILFTTPFSLLRGKGAY